MARSRRPRTSAPANQLLAALPPAESARLLARTETVSLAAREVLYRAGAPVKHVYFPVTGVVSKIVSRQDGRAAEARAVGNEGMVGLTVFLGDDTSPSEVLCQVPGEALKMRAADFASEVRQSGQLQSVLRRYTRAVLCAAAQSIACNCLHSVEQRCARWLLATRDRTGADEFPLTQELLALMLGVRRASVTLAAGALQEAGLITYHLGRITILDPEGLEEAACECYRAVRNCFDRS